MAEARERPGVGVDSSGSSVVDPTANVVALSEASSARQDDLRIESSRRIDAAISHSSEISLLRSEYTDKIATLRTAQADRISELRSIHQKEMDSAESQRLDSIRSVDIQAAAATATQILTAVQTLAGSTGTMAENLRASTASTISEVNKRLSQLEQSSYEGMGKQKVADPQMQRMADLVEKMASTQAGTAGKSSGIDASWAKIFAIISAICAVGYLVMTLKH